MKSKEKKILQSKPCSLTHSLIRFNKQIKINKNKTSHHIPASRSHTTSAFTIGWGEQRKKNN
jgi:hypothetical protein